MQAQTNTADSLLTLDEAAEYMRCSKVTIWKLRKEEKIKFTCIGRKVLLRKLDIDAYFQKHSKEAIYA